MPAEVTPPCPDISVITRYAPTGPPALTGTESTRHEDSGSLRTLWRAQRSTILAARGGRAVGHANAATIVASDAKERGEEKDAC
jgi:hypothetical protein